MKSNNVNPEHRSDRTAAMLGTVRLEPLKPVVAGSYGSWTLTLKVGAMGIDEGGLIKIARRFASDWERPQFDRPSESGYTTVTTGGEARLAVRFDPKGHHRPWMKCIMIDVYDGSLAPGDEVTVVFGDTTVGAPGIRAQTFQESHHEIRVFVDPTNACRAQLVPNCPAVSIIPGAADSLTITLPSQSIQGEGAICHVQAWDTWGNPANLPEPPPLQWDGPGRARFARNKLTVDEEGTGYVTANWNGQTILSNPITLCRQLPAYRHYWGDLHAQTGATVGTGTEEEYFTFGRDVARLDFISHQGNDFQMTDADWERLNAVAKNFHRDGHYVVFPGYEWSANSTAGGDRNVFYLEEGLPIIRHSPWQIADHEAKDLHTHVPVNELFKELRARVPLDKVVCGSHVGGRYADISKGFDAELGPLVEVVSCWGVFEWLLHDAIRQGHTFGVMCNSDGHKGRPGAEGPGAGDFGVAGGLTCILAKEHSRQALFEALRNRRCYGTSGPRIALDFTGNGQPMGSVLTSAKDTPLTLKAGVRGTAPIEKIEMFRGLERIAVRHAAGFEDMDRTHGLRILWGGSRIRGRGRRVNWDGSLTLKGNRIRGVRPVSFDSPADSIRTWDEHQVTFASKTTGDKDGVELVLEKPSDTGELHFNTQVTDKVVHLNDLSNAGIHYELGGIDITLAVNRYPESLNARSLSLEHSVEQHPPGKSAYYVKVMQCDGHMAWSSPVFTRE